MVFLFGALPGEEVTARVTRVRAHYAFADTVEVHRPAPGRVEPPCPYFGVCGGCQLQHADYPLQLAIKEEVLRDALRRQGLEAPAATEVVGSPQQWRYRWRGEFHLRPDRPRLGFTVRDGHQLLGVTDCPIHHPAITGLLEWLGESLKTSPRPPQTVHLTVGSGGREVLLQSRPDRHAGEALAVAGDPPGEVRITSESTQLSYRGRSFRVFPDAFIQVNQGALENLYETVVTWLGPNLTGSRVVDAYGGSGILSLRLADAGAQVTVIESNPVSARLGQLHAEMYGEDRVVVLRGQVEEQLPQVEELAAVVLDPPRAGLDPRVSGWLALAGPPTLAYLSCEVSALARDLETLCRLGPYRLERLRLVDMFPQTYHFEVVALLRR